VNGLLGALVLFAASPLVFVGSLHGQEPAEHAHMEELNGLRVRLQQAETEGDLEALADVYADDVIFQTPETAAVVGSDAVIALWGFFLERFTLESTYTSVGIQASGDEAEDRGTVVQTYTPLEGGPASTDTLQYALQYRRSAPGPWRVVSTLYSSEPEPELRIPRLPEPTGPYEIGSLDLLYVDSSRAEFLTDDPADVRTVSAQIWYPASVPAGAKPGKYRTPEATRAAAAFLGWPIFFNSVFALVDTHSFPCAPPSTDPGPFPVILYHHGYGGFTRVHTVLIEELASHGYVVASVGHAYESAFLQGPDLLIPFDPDNPAYVERLAEAHGDEQEALKDAIVGAGNIEEQGNAYRALLAASPRHQESARMWTADGSFILDRLAELNEPGGFLAGTLDLSRVGVVGHSLGGAAAGQAVVDDDRVIAGVDMDGFMFGDYVGSNSDRAFMFMSAARPWAGVGGSALTVFFERAGGPAYLVLIDGFEHSSFTDLPLFASVWPGEGSGSDGERALQIQRAYIRAFFDRHLTGREAPLLDGRSDAYPEVGIRSRGASSD
jgi:predicted dienelactone hydrolase